jgi:hypothetical protein
MSAQSNAAYLAGFMDGEGSFSIVKTYQIKQRVDGSKVKNIRYHLHVKITNTNKTVLDWIVEHFGGQLSNKKQVREWKPKWDLTITGNASMERFILAIMPYLIVKKKQAQTALDFARLHGQDVPEERDRLRQIMLQLNNSSQCHSKSVTTNTPNMDESVLKIESELTGDCESEPAVT